MRGKTVKGTVLSRAILSKLLVDAMSSEDTHTTTIPL